MANAQFIRHKSSKENNDQGDWKLNKGTPEQWFINYNYKEMNLKFRLGFTSFKHVGIFPEQADNWNFIYDTLKSMNIQQPKVLNLFAYTGGASIAARAAGAEVTHLDSIKQVVSWARENMEASKLDNIRWMIEDAMVYAKREARRGKKYNGLILDPPAYGRGTNGERWVLDDSINEMLKHCNEILADENSFLVLNLYSLGLSAMVAENLVASTFPNIKSQESGEFYLNDRFNKKLPLGTFLRFKR
jgi:23S rRNA (cytosine1962-C5)-methyltransferase